MAPNVQVALTASNTTLAEGDFFDLTVTLTQAGDVAGKQLLVELHGPIRVDGLPGAEKGQIELVSLWPSAAVPSWAARLGTSPEIVPVQEGGGYQLSYATERDANPLRLRYGAGVPVGETWTLTYRCIVLSGGSGRFKVTARAVESADPILYAGLGDTSSVNLTLTRHVRTPTLTAPSALSATASGNTVALSWTLNSTGESGLEVFRAPSSTGPWERAARLARGATSFTDRILDYSTTYYYRVCAFGLTDHGSFSVAASATTEAADAAPTGTPTTLTLAAYGAEGVLVQWALGTVAGHTRWSIERSTTEGGSYTAIGNTGPGNRAFVDWGVAAGTVYWYKVRPVGEGGNGNYTTADDATTARVSRGRSGVPAITGDPAGRHSFVNIGGRTLIFSDRDRPIVRGYERWDYAGLRPPLTAPTLAEGGAGALNGTFKAYYKLLRSNGQVRSNASPEMTSGQKVTVENKALTITPPWDDDEDRITIRDDGSDDFGNTIDGADLWEAYLAEDGTTNAWRIGVAPLNQTQIATDGGLTLSGLNDGTRRPMEQQLQNTLLPACAFAAARAKRIAMCGQIDHSPEQTGAEMTLTQGSKTITTESFDLNESMLGKRLFVEGNDTGWELTDVVSFTEGRISHADQNINEVGWNQQTMTATDFAFIKKPGVVFFSSYYNGESGFLPTLSPETQSPLIQLQTELDPDDTEDFSGIIASRDAWFVTKPGRVFCIYGGTSPGNDFLKEVQVTTVSRTIGVVSHHSLVTDPTDTVWGLSASGPVMIRRSGVTQVGRFADADRAFDTVFEMSTAHRSVAEWHSEAGVYICFGLDAKGEVGGLSGFWLDPNTRLMTRFKHPRRITGTFEYTNDQGEKVVGFVDEAGMKGRVFARGISRDDVDLTRSNPAEVEQSYGARLLLPEMTAPQALEVADGRGGTRVMQGPGEVDIILLYPSFRVYDSDSAASVTAEVCNRPRMGKMTDFDASAGKTATFDTDTEDFLQELECDPAHSQQLRLTVTPPRDGRVECSEITGVAAYHGLAAEMGE